MSKINILEALRVSLTSIKNYINENYYNTSKIDELLNEKADTDDLFSRDYNDLNNKPDILSVEDLPCYDSREYETVTLTYDGNKETKEVLDVVPGEVSFVKITDNISIDDLERLSTADVTICMSSSDGQTQENTINIADSGGCEFVQENIYRAAESFILLVLEDTDFSGTDIAKGIWVMHVNESSLSDYYAKSLTYNTCISGELKKLDEKYLEKKPGICSEGKVYTYTIYDDPDERTIETTLTDICGPGAESFNTTEHNEPKAIGECSHAEGFETIAYGFASHAEGDENVALGEASHVEGLYNYAIGYAAHAEGVATSAMKDSSHAEGESTIANCESQHVQGKYNIKDTEDKYAHIVGNGSSKEERSNAHTLDWDGNAWFQGDIFVKGTSQNDAQKIATEDYVDNKLSGLTIIRITQAEYDALATKDPNTLYLIIN